VHVHPGPGARQASPAHAKAKDGRKAKAGAG
jgi:hypothetical protein